MAWFNKEELFFMILMAILLPKQAEAIRDEAFKNKVWLLTNSNISRNSTALGVTNQTKDSGETPVRRNTSSGTLFKKLLETNSCDIQVDNESRLVFSNEVFKKNYNFMYLKLQFPNQSDIADTKKVINRFDWIWTYEGEDGAKQLLYVPEDFGYLSFGFLWLRTRTEPLYIHFRTKGDCNQLRIGTNETDDLIGKALGFMTNQIASQNIKYNSSYWCYNYRKTISPQSIYWLCSNSICTFQTIEYRCCKYVLYINMTRTVECNKEDYAYGALWWLLPIIVGNVLFAFYPILLTKFGMSMTEFSRSIKKQTRVQLNTPSDVQYERHIRITEDDIRKSTYVSLKVYFPISFTSTLLSPLIERTCHGPCVTRILRILIILVPVTLSAVQVYLDYMYANQFFLGAVEKGALVGFSSILAGPKASEQFLVIFNGPIIALVIFIAFSIIVVAFPKQLDVCLTKGLPEISGKYVFLIKIPLKLRERFSGVKFRKYNGYKQLHYLMISQTFMLLQWKFWRHAFKLFSVRWSNLIFPFMTEMTGSFILAVVLCVLIFPMYVMFSFIELILVAIYFMFPVFNSSLIVLKAFIMEYFSLFHNKGFCLKCLRNILVLPLVGLFLMSWYMYCIIFFDAFWFLSKIVMFTYTGIIAYPKLSYGYLILCFMSMYYLIESINAFSESYRDLLKVSVDVIEKILVKQDDEHSRDVKELIDGHRLNKDLFFHIVDRCRPRRNQVMITLFKVVSTISVLSISVRLLMTFDKFEDLSLVTHVFTVLFVCSLPKIFHTFCIKSYQVNRKHRLRANIKQTIFHFISHRQHCISDDDNDDDAVLLREHDIVTNDNMCGDA